MINLLDLNLPAMRSFFDSIGEKSYRAVQLLKWIHQAGQTDFANMNNLSKELRIKLAQHAAIKLPTLITEQIASDGTRKWLLRLTCGNAIETVFIPELTRGTLCISSQVGCGLNCSFCSTAKQGFNRNLTTGEIISQIWFAVHNLAEDTNYSYFNKVTNVVLMGMGEPLLNFTAVTDALDLMLDDNAYGLSKYRVTLSTSGLIPEMLKLKARSPVALAVSLHAPNDSLRDELVPLNKKYNLAQLIDTCKNYFPKDSKRKVTFEYVMLQGVNDKPHHAKELIKLLHNVPAKVNLIPFNPFPLTHYKRSSNETINIFRDLLMQAGIHTMTRKTRGDDIDAACGQLAGKVNDRTSRSARWLKINSVQTEAVS